MLSMLLVAGGLALTCILLLWNVVNSYDEDRHRNRNGTLVVLAMWAACGNVGMNLALLKNALPGNPEMGFGLVVLAASVLVCASCLVITGFSYGTPRHHERNFHLLMIAGLAAYVGTFMVLLMMLLEFLEVVLPLALAVVMVVGMVWFFGERPRSHGESGSGYSGGAREDSDYDGYGGVSGDGGDGGGGD
ncbi:hypothetical protein ACFW4K_01485 [Nocardiopsis alba]|uniref:hypothetical protein n=1 Tax=Nocardiopsis alba TaxID=53437 RepID=UPI003672F3F6